jgi:hypothetical protein
MAFKMKGTTFFGKPKASTSKAKVEGESPLKGFLGKLLNPAQMLPGKLGKLAGKLPGSNM